MSSSSSSFEPLEARSLLSIAHPAIVVADGGPSLTSADPIGTVTGTVVVRDQLSTGEQSDAFKFNVPTTGNVNVFLSGLKANGNIRLFDKTGKRLAYSARAKTRTETMARVLAPGEYTVTVDRAKRAANTPFALTVQADLNYENVAIEGRSYKLSLIRADHTAAPIVPTRETWVVIHGWQSAPRHVDRIAKAIDAAHPDDQVLELDWSSVAASTDSAGVFRRIPAVAAWVAKKLSNWGIAGGSVNLAGHSFGGYMTDEVASRITGGVNRVVALDPATRPSAAASRVNYAGHSRYSVAFVCSSYGDQVAARTADETIKVDLGTWSSVDTHSRIRDFYAGTIERANAGDDANAVSNLFSIDAIAPGQVRPFLPDGEGNGFEALLTARDDGTGAWLPTRAQYKYAFSGAAIDVTE